MSMELTPVARKYLSYDLQRFTDRISAYDCKIRSNQYAIAYLMNKVSERKLYEQDGFTSAIEWAKDAFCIEKSTAYNLINLGKEYVIEVRDEKGTIIGYCSNLVVREQYKLPAADFTPNKVMMLSPMGRDNIVTAIESGNLKLTSTSNDIRAMVKAYRALNVTESQPTDTTEPTQPSEQAQSTEPIHPTESTETSEQSLSTEPTVKTAVVDHARDAGWDIASSSELIAELVRRGFAVTRDGIRYDIKWPD